MLPSNKDRGPGVLTDVVPAASGGGAAAPASLEHVDLPVSLGVVRQVIRGHVADLHAVVVHLKVVKLHPGVTKPSKSLPSASNSKVLRSETLTFN